MEKKKRQTGKRRLRTGNARRLTALVMALAMVLTLLPTGGFSLRAKAAESDFAVKSRADGTLEITKYNGSDAEVEIPAVIDGLRVTSIGVQAFYKNEDITRVKVPKGVTTMGRSVFEGCTGLTDVELPEGLTDIPMSAFYNCKALEHITLPGSLTGGSDVPTVVGGIGYYAFGETKKLSKINIPENVTGINHSAFKYAEALADISIPVSTTIIGTNAFYWCNALTTIHYTGTESDWDAITGDGKTDDLKAKVHYLTKVTEGTLYPYYKCTADGCDNCYAERTLAQIENLAAYQTTIRAAQITVAEPKAGETPAATATAAEPSLYTAGAPVWEGKTGDTWTAFSGSFVGGKEYRVSIPVTPASGYALAADAVTINGEDVTADGSVYRAVYTAAYADHTCAGAAVTDAGSLNPYYQCATCGKYYEDAAYTTEIASITAYRKTVREVAFTVTEPTAGFNPDKTPVPADAALYDKASGTSAVIWSPKDEPFVAGTTYKVTVTVSATNGLIDLKKATINGQEATIEAYNKISLQMTAVASDHTHSAALVTTDTASPYYYCAGCNNAYTDAACTDRIADLDTYRLTVKEMAFTVPTPVVGGTPAEAADCESAKPEFYKIARVTWWVKDGSDYKAFSGKFQENQTYRVYVQYSRQVHPTLGTNYKLAEGAKVTINGAAAEDAGMYGSYAYYGYHAYFTTGVCAHSTLTKQEAVPATCGKDGVKEYWKCNACGAAFSAATADEAHKIADFTAWKTGDGKIAATGIHTNLTATAEVAATCKKEGTKAYWRCNECNTYFSAATDGVAKDTDKIGNYAALNTWKAGDGKIAATGIHTNLTATAAVAATCKKEGTKAYWYCKDCYTYFSKATDGAAVDADKIGDSAALTAWKAGDGKTPKTGVHTNLTATAEVAATCAKEGTKAYWRCNDCSAYFSKATEGKAVDADKIGDSAALTAWKAGDGKTPKSDTHTNLKETAEVPATCAADGVKAYWTCDCGKRFTTAAGDTEIADFAAWKTGAGKIDSLPHSGVTAEPMKPATCKEDGVKTYWTCPDCGKYFTTEACDTQIPDLTVWKNGAGKIAKLTTHTPAATWIESGTGHWCACTVCGTTLSEDHDLTSEVTTEAATFDEDGKKVTHTTCSKCTYERTTTEVLAAGKYIRMSAVTMEPAYLSSDICADELVFTPAEAEKYTVGLFSGRVYDLTDEALNTEDGKYPLDAKFVAGHQYVIELAFQAVGSYKYDETDSDRWSTFTVNGMETKISAVSMVSGSRLRRLELTAQVSGHTHSGVLKEGTPATCSQTGKKDYYACGCGLAFEQAGCLTQITNLTEWIVIPKKDHTPVEDAAVEPTCTASGKTAGTHCSVCGEVLTAQSYVAPLGHTLGGWETDNVNHYKVCSVCHMTQELTAHTGGEATCTAKAVCGDCGVPYGSVDAANHSFETEWTYDGTNHWHKATCVHTDEKADEAAHTYGADNVCTVCGQTHTHSGTPVPGTPATCTVDGVKDYYTCGCGKNFEDAACTAPITEDIDTWKVIPALGHTPGPEATETTPQTCTVCGAVLKPALSHTHAGTIVPGKAAACTEAGWKEYYTCGCGQYFADAACTELIETDIDTWKVIPAPGHTPGPDATETTPQTCTVCGTVLKPALSHTHAGTIVPGKDATCTEAGWKEYYTCGCGQYFEDAACTAQITEDVDTWKVIPAPGHDFALVRFDETGHWKECARCGEPSEKAPHEYSGEDRDCDVCGFVKGLSVMFADEEASYPYTGSAVKPEIIVRNYGRELTEGVDYTVSYKNNVNASTGAAANKKPTVIVKGKGDFAGTTQKTFEITPCALDDATAGSVIVVRGSKAVPVLMYNGYKLGAKDYTNPDAAKKFMESDTVVLTGKGNFSGEKSIAVTVVESKADLKKFSVTLGNAKLSYDGSVKKPSCTVKDAATKADLTEGEDYIVTYAGDMVNAGTVKMTFTGVGSYAGSVVKSYAIKPCTTAGSVSASGLKTDGYAYQAGGVKPESDLKVTYQAEGVTKVLTPGKDYTLSFSGYAKVGAAKYTVKFIGNYKGMKALSGTYQVKAAVLDDATDGLKISVADMVYTGKPGTYVSKPVVSVGGVLLKTSDYSVSYYADEAMTKEIKGKNNLIALEGDTPADVYVKVTGKGSYGADAAKYATASYQVCPAAEVIDLKGAKILFKDKSGNVSGKFEYTGREVTPAAVVQVKEGKTWKEIPADKYTVEYHNNLLKGKATVVVKAKAGSGFAGGKTATFNIVAQNVSTIKDLWNK